MSSDRSPPEPCSAEHTAAETILAIAAYRRDEQSGECTRRPCRPERQHQRRSLHARSAGGHLAHLFRDDCRSLPAGDVRQLYHNGFGQAPGRHLISEIHEKIYGRFSAYFGTVFAGFFSDEPAFGNCDGKYGDDYAGHKMGQLRRFIHGAPMWRGSLWSGAG